jgi:hypothetical protein
MTDFTIKIAGQVVAVSAMFDSSRDYCKEYLCDEKAAFAVQISARDLALEREKSAKTDLAEGKTLRKLSDSALEVTAIQRKIAEQLFEKDILLMHGSVVAVDGEAYLFTAKSGTGKSTHSRLWRQVLGERAKMVNDDKPFLRITREGVLACGSPWNGKHRLGENISVPLKAICILERDAENSIGKISAADALGMLLQQTNRPQMGCLMPKYLELVDALSRHVEFYRLRCNQNPEAALVAYRAMAPAADAGSDG